MKLFRSLLVFGTAVAKRLPRLLGLLIRAVLEVALIGGAAGTAVLGPALALRASGQPLWPELEPVVWLVGAFVVAHLWFRLVRRRHDPILLPVTLLLCGLGWTVLTRSRPDLLIRAYLASGIGLALLLGMAHAGWVRRLEQYRYLCMALGLGLLAATVFFGREVNGAKLSLGTDRFHFQPTEAVKMLLAIFTAGLLADRKELLVLGRPRHRHPGWYDLRYLAPLFIVWGVAEGLLVAQNDLGASLLLFGIFAVLLYAVTGQRFYLTVSGGLFAFGAVAAYFLIDRVQLRMALWWNPWPLAEGKGYQTVQALYALGSGGLTGLGVGAGFPRLLPAVHTDLPLALLGEEIGLAGTLMLLLAYAALLLRGVRAALRAGEEGGGLLALGLTAALGIQALVIVGGITRALPLTGITLPFVSYGGASLAANMALVGMLILLSGPVKVQRADLIPLRSARWRSGARRVGAALVLMLAALGGVLFYWQWLRAPWLSFHPGNRRLALLETRVHRGDLRDRQGRVVVASRPARGSRLAARGSGAGGPDPGLGGPASILTPVVMPATATNEGLIARFSHAFSPHREPRFLPLAGEPRARAYARRYVDGPLTAPLTGYIHPIYGRTGAEKIAHRGLVGIPPVRTLEEAVRWVERHPRGNDVNMTLDLRLQRIADRALGPRRGSVIALDPRTGGVLVLVSHPSFDPAMVATRWEALQRDPRHPLLCRPTQGVYPPGSSFKLVTATAALENGVMRPDTPCFCGGAFFIGSYRIPCFHGSVHGHLSFGEALARSCNVTFARVGTRVGDRRLLQQAARFGLGRPIPGDLETSRSRVPPPEQHLRRAITAQIAFGQGPLAVTPMQMAMIGAAIANNGVMMRPQIVHSVVSPEGKRLSRLEPLPLRRAMRPETAAALRAMMTHCVASGTGGRARLPGVAVAGKTGTAQNPHGEDHAWFIGFAPAEKPRILVTVLVENGGVGGRVAAPVAREVLAAALGVSLEEPVVTQRRRGGDGAQRTWRRGRRIRRGIRRHMGLLRPAPVLPGAGVPSPGLPLPQPSPMMGPPANPGEKEQGRRDGPRL